MAVSVIIPAYNASAYIGVALSSVYAQSFADFEVIVINDGSSDHDQLEKVLAPYLSKLTYLQQQNAGPSAARNLGIRTARGEFLAFLDSDDSWLPEYLAEQMTMLQSDPSLDMIYSDALFQGETASDGKRFMEVCPSHGPVTFESLLLEETQVITSGTVVRRQSVVDAGLFDEALHCAEDHDLWLRIAYRGGKISYHRKVLLQHLVRPDSQGSSGRLLQGQIEVLRKINRTLELSLHTRSLLAEKLKNTEAILASMRAKERLLAGDYSQAEQLFSNANEIAPSTRTRLVLLGLRTSPQLTRFLMRNRDRFRAQ